MSKFEASFPIEKHRHDPGGLSYDLIVYQRGNRYHAAWFCKKCLSRTETNDFANRGAAKQAAETEIDAHYVNNHLGREPDLLKRRSKS